MPPKTVSGAGRGRPKGSKNRRSLAREAEPESSNPFQSSDEQASSVEDETPHQRRRGGGGGGGTMTEGREVDEDASQPEKTIPRDLLTRLLHEFFAKDATRISRDANAAAGKYVDVFVREAIARTAVEKQGGFLEVDDLEKVAPQLLLDL